MLQAVRPDLGGKPYRMARRPLRPVVRSCAVDRRRLVWMTVFVTALVSIIVVAWTFAVPSGDTAAAPADDPAATDDDASDSSDASSPAGPSLTSDTDGGSATTDDAYTTLTRPPDTEADAAPVPLAATSSVPRTTAATSLAAPTTLPSCVDPLTSSTARCVTTTAPGPGATGGVCDTSVGRTTDPGCTGGTGFPTTTSIATDPCAGVTTIGCPAGTTVPATTAPAPTATTAPPVTCFPVSCPATTRLTP